MAFRLFPKSTDFFTLFDEQAGYAVEAAQIFKEITEKGEVSHANYEKIQHLEHKADDAAHAIIEHLNNTFIAPFDREDIHALAIRTDDIIDIINAIVNRLRIYKISGENKRLVEFASVIEDSVKALAKAVHGLNNTKNVKAIQEACVEVNRLENVGDAMRDDFLAELFENEKDPIAVIKWKEIYQDAETVLDICEDVANMVDNILVKHA